MVFMLTSCLSPALTNAVLTTLRSAGLLKIRENTESFHGQSKLIREALNLDHMLRTQCPQGHPGRTVLLSRSMPGFCVDSILGKS